MAVSARVYLGVFVFALLAAMALIPLTVMIVSGYEPAPLQPLTERWGYSFGDKVALVMASLVSVILVVASWRVMLDGARRRQELLAQRRRGGVPIEFGGDGGRDEPRARRDEGRDDEPPGYG